MAKPAAAIRLAGINAFASIQQPLDSRRITIGSSADNNLVLAHSSVSRRHAVIRRQFGRYAVKDLGSTNGTFINGQRVARVRVIKPGDEIRFGAARFAVVGRKPRRRYLRRIAAFVTLCAAFAAIGFYAVRFEIAPNPQESTAASSVATAKPVQTEAHARATANAAASAAAKSRAESKATPRPGTPVAAAAAPAARTASAAGVSPPWLARVNYFRLAAGLAPVVEDSALSDGDAKHAIYLVKNYGDLLRNHGNLGADAHTEDRSKPYYTLQGERAAHSSDESEEVAAVLSNPETWAIDDWMTVPFHRLFILSPLLKSVGYGQYCENQVCVAMLNVLSGSERPPMGGAPLARPVEFPPSGFSVPSKMSRMTGEWPSPLVSCDDYSVPSGLPATLQIGPRVDAQLSAFSFSCNGEKVDACGIDASDYRNSSADEHNRVVQVLRGQGAIVIVPKQPLTPGARYEVSATVNGRDYRWSFTVAP